MSKFTELELKWHVQMQNSTVSSTKFDWRLKSKWKLEKKNKRKRYLKKKVCKIYKKFHNLTRENSLNCKSNDKRKCRIERWIQPNSIKDSNHRLKGRTIRKNNDIWKWKFAVSRKSTQFEFKCQVKMQNWTANSTKFDWTFKSKFKREKNKKKHDISKWKFAKFQENYTIFQEKIHWTQNELTIEHAKFNGKFSQIRLNI